MKLARVAPVLLPILMWVGVSRAMDPRAPTWTTNGPQDGSVVTALAIDADRGLLYVGTAGGGVFRSNNGGRTWTAASEGLASGWVPALAIVPRTPSTLYASAAGAGVFKSTDGGETWKACGVLPSFGANALSYVTTLAVDPSQPGTVYAGTEPFWSPSRFIYGALYKSVDGGETWTVSTTPFNVVQVVVDPHSPTTVYASAWSGLEGPPWNETYRGAILSRSTDAGRTWLDFRSGLPPFGYHDIAYAPPVGSLVIDPHDSTTLYACGGYGIFKTTGDSGVWSEASAGLPRSPSSYLGYAACGAIVIDPAHPATLYASMLSGGLFKSTDAGGSWVQAGSDTNIQGAFVLAFDPSKRDTLYAGGLNGLSIRRDGGDDWKDASDGIVNSHINALAADPRRAGVVYAGGSWGPAQGYGYPGVGVFKSLDHGRHWKPASAGLTTRYVRSLAIDPQTPTTLYALTQDGLFRSTNAGESWSDTGWVYGGVVAVDPRSSAVYMGGYGVQRSDDGGVTWTAVNEGLDVEGLSYISALLFGPGDPATLYVATFTGEVFRSVNGARWQRLGLARGGLQLLAFDPRTPSTLYASWREWNLNGTIIGGGIQRSDDGGTSWKAVGTGPESVALRRILSLAVDPRAPSILYAGTEDGIFLSADRGETWSAFNSGINGLPVEALLVDPQGSGAIYAGTRSGGVFVAAGR